MKHSRGHASTPLGGAGTGGKSAGSANTPLTYKEKLEQNRTAISLLASVGDPRYNRDYRNNPSILIRYRRIDPFTLQVVETNILIDCGKTFREAAVRWFPIFKVTNIDAVILTHGHADAMFGLDDLRSTRARDASPIEVYQDASTREVTKKVFQYLYPEESANETETEIGKEKGKDDGREANAEDGKMEDIVLEEDRWLEVKSLHHHEGDSEIDKDGDMRMLSSDVTCVSVGRVRAIECKSGNNSENNSRSNSNERPTDGLHGKHNSNIDSSNNNSINSNSGNSSNNSNSHSSNSSNSGNNPTNRKSAGISIEKFVQRDEVTTKKKTTLNNKVASIKRFVSNVSWKEIQHLNEFEAASLKITPIPVMHGEDLKSLGFIFGEKDIVVYISDISRMLPESMEVIRAKGNIALLVIDALHPTTECPVHYSLTDAIKLCREINPQKCLVIGMTTTFPPHDICNNQLKGLWQNGDGIDIQLACDGLKVELNL